MAYQSTRDDQAADTNTFYRRTLHVLSDAQVPFLVGGSHAYLHYTGIERSTKDFDLFVRRADCPRALVALELAGYRTELTFPHWLGKAFQGEDHIDLVFSSGNGVCQVDDGWFENAVEAQVLNMPVKLLPVEELLWQKAFIMERDRFDGADIVHLLRAQAAHLDWARLHRRFEPHWQLLLSYLTLFCFVYPSEAAQLPTPVMQELLGRLQSLVTSGSPNGDRVCQGTLLSRSQYLIDIGRWGYQDARLAPRGNMSAEDIVYWTWAIQHIP